jgi:hypothetical protein
MDNFARSMQVVKSEKNLLDEPFGDFRWNHLFLHHIKVLHILEVRAKQF